MKLSAPRVTTFLASLALVGAAVASLYRPIPFVSDNAFWTAVAGYGLLAIGTLFRDA
ncbi:MAG: hypothetical protein U1F24_06540 [Alphaproteobacteria bacterium]|jgi:hypothetical protein